MCRAVRVSAEEAVSNWRSARANLRKSEGVMVDKELAAESQKVRAFSIVNQGR
jgi:hypothetical protein